jgi:hypothetical protein
MTCAGFFGGKSGLSLSCLGYAGVHSNKEADKISWIGSSKRKLQHPPKNK